MRVIDADGAQLGILTREEALRVAEEQELDLVEVAPDADPPVCRVIDHGKYLYREKKKEQESKRKKKQQQRKEIQFRPGIDEHDYQVKARRLFRFLEEGHRVEVTIRFRGREMSRMDLGEKLLQRLREEMGERGVVDSSPERAGNRMRQVFAPPRKGGRRSPGRSVEGEPEGR